MCGIGAAMVARVCFETAAVHYIAFDQSQKKLLVHHASREASIHLSFNQSNTQSINVSVCAKKLGTTL